MVSDDSLYLLTVVVQLKLTENGAVSEVAGISVEYVAASWAWVCEDWCCDESFLEMIEGLLLLVLPDDKLALRLTFE